MNYSTRVLISGVPRSGKTTLSKLLAGKQATFHTDTLMGGDTFEKQGHLVASLLEDNNYYIYEGCMVVRGVREWFNVHIDEAPCEVFIWLEEPRTALNSSQQKVLRNIKPVFDSVIDELQNTGVVILRGPF